MKKNIEERSELKMEITCKLSLQQLVFYLQMRILRSLKKMVEMTDFFNSSQMLRYENENQYRTFTGGVLSLAIIVTIVIGFASMIIDTLTLSSISYTQNVQTHTDPTLTTITTSPDNNFMFAIEIYRQNLSSPVRYFDVEASLYNLGDGARTMQSISLVPCTKEHWASMPDIVGKFDKLRISGWLCPAIGSQFEIMGKLTSTDYKQIVFGIAPCNNATDPDRLCASPEQIKQNFADNLGYFYFTFYYINTIINPDQPQYKSYYLQDNVYVTFGEQLGSETYLYFSDFNIQSDYSIWPFTSLKEDNGFMTQSLPMSHPYSITSDSNVYYVLFSVAKSPNSIFISREVQKISTVFSFIGGLIGAIMAGLFIINSYTSFAFELSIALSIFKPDKRTQEQVKQKGRPIVNLIQFIQYYWYGFRKWAWREYVDEGLEHVHECRREILRQLDIKSLIKRLVFLEYSMTFIFTDFQLEGLQLHKPASPHEVKAVRKRIENIDLADLETNFSETPRNNDQALNDMIEPSTKFNLGEFVKSPKVANLQSPTGPLYKLDRKPTIKGRECHQTVEAESVSGISIIHEPQKRVKIDLQKKRSIRIKNLMESAKQGNQLSLRIWETIRTINQENEDPKP